jgi:hypothetical protein
METDELGSDRHEPMPTAGAKHLGQAIVLTRLPPPQHEGSCQMSRHTGVWGGMKNRRPVPWRLKTRGCDLTDRSPVADPEPRWRSAGVPCEALFAGFAGMFCPEGGEHAGKTMRWQARRGRRMTVSAPCGGHARPDQPGEHEAAQSVHSPSAATRRCALAGRGSAR